MNIIAADQLAALPRLLAEPTLAFAPWTVARSAIESVSQSVWLLEPSIGAVDRAARGMSARHQSLSDQLVWMKTAKQTETTVVEIERANERLGGLLRSAVERAVPVLRNKKGNVTGYGSKGMPRPTALTKLAGYEGLYRLFSGVTHARPWATLSTGFQRVGDTQIVTPLLSPYMAQLLIAASLRAWLSSVFAMFVYAGWNIRDLAAVCDPILDSAGFTRAIRPWA